MPDGIGFACGPPLLHGTARLAALAYAGAELAELLDLIGPEPGGTGDRAAWLMDRSVAHALCFEPFEAADLQASALALARVYRVRGTGRGIRLLALCAAGDLMVNTPLDFITEAVDVRLDLAFIHPDGSLPDPLPPHDVAIVAASECAPEVIRVLGERFDAWPVPILNDPRRSGLISRDWLAAVLRDVPGIAAPLAVRVTRSALEAHAIDALLPGGAYPVLLRPLQSHAGHGLMRLAGADDLRLFLMTTRGDNFYLTQFVDYRGRDGWYRKCRVAFIDGVPFLCHMAASERWMVHYLNAGMAESAAKRAAEAQAMAEFDGGFARCHAGAFARLCSIMGLDYFSIDCGEAPDGRLLVFEADVAAIIHSMDPPDLYPYKRAPMQRCYEAFAAMLARRIAAAAPLAVRRGPVGSAQDGQRSNAFLL